MAYTTPQMCSVLVKDAANPPSFTVRGTTPEKNTTQGGITYIISHHFQEILSSGY